MPRELNRVQEPRVFQYFQPNQRGRLEISGRARFFSMVIPGYYQRKVDSAAKALLEQLKNSYLTNTNRENELNFAEQILTLNPSRAIAAEVNAYAYAILANRPEALDHNPFQVTIDQALSERLIALGLPLEQQRRHPDLMKMIQVNDLVDYFEGVNYKIDHEEWAGTHLSFTSTQHDEPVLVIDGQPTPWSQAKVTLFGEGTNETTVWTLPPQWRLDSQGISPYSMANWETLTPCGSLRDHDGNFYLDVMSTTEGLNHNWIRLINSNGEVISAGLCGEIYSFAMMRSSVGKLNSPDHREFFKPETHRTTRIQITAETYQNLKENKLEADQRTHNLFFSLMTRNCSRYACEVAQEGGVALNNTEFVEQLGMRMLLNRIHLTPSPRVLKVIQKLLYIPRLFSGFTFAVVMGAWYQNSDVRELENNFGNQWRTRPRKPFRSFRSFFDGSNTRMASSMKVGHWQDFVADYRRIRREHLSARRATFAREGHFYSSQFARNWRQLEHTVAHEMPPELGTSHLFLNDQRNITVQDIEDRIQQLIS